MNFIHFNIKLVSLSQHEFYFTILHGMNLDIFKNEGKLKRFHKVFKVVKTIRKK